MCGSEYLETVVQHDRAKDGGVSLFRFNTERERWQEYDAYLNGWTNSEGLTRFEDTGRAVLKEEFLSEAYFKVVEYAKTWADAEFVTDLQIRNRYDEINQAENDYYNDESHFEFDEF
jgi:hypothetical protein